MDKRTTRLMIWLGLALALLGGYLLYQQLATAKFVGGTFLLLVGLILILGDVMIKNLGVLIPGGVAVGLGGAWVVGSLGGVPYVPAPSVFMLMMTVGFLLIYLLGWRRTGVWPLVVALCVGAAGLLSLLLYNLDMWKLTEWIIRWWPLTLVAAGVALILVGVLPSRGRKAQVQPEAPVPAQNIPAPQAQPVSEGEAQPAPQSDVDDADATAAMGAAQDEEQTKAPPADTQD